jgi:hypothetical protein
MKQRVTDAVRPFVGDNTKGWKKGGKIRGHGIESKGKTRGRFR